MPYRPEFDSLRALAVLAVFSSHVAYPGLEGGWIGVGVFFVLSGYLITSILFSEWTRTGAISLTRFWVRRLLRLYPALLVMLLACAFFAPVFGDAGTASGYMTTALSTGLYVQDLVVGLTGSAQGGFLHTWSLAVEEQFYVIWPPLLILILKRRRSALGWALAGTAGSWILLTLTTASRGDVVPATYVMPYSRAGELLLGCALAAWLARNPVSLARTQITRWLGPAGTAGLLALAAVAGQAGMSRWMPFQIMAVALFSAALIIGITYRQDSTTAHILRWRPLVWPGGISYGFYLYLYHLPVMDLSIRYLRVPWALQILDALAITILLSAISYRIVERPFLRLKKRAWAGGTESAGGGQRKYVPHPRGESIAAAHHSFSGKPPQAEEVEGLYRSW